MTGRRVRMLALHPLWRKARRVYSLASRLPGTNRLGFQPSLALSERVSPIFMSSRCRVSLCSILCLWYRQLAFSTTRDVVSVSSSHPG
ncbi:MAG: hypothetical protein LC539_05190 [Candidatus Thiodiazotropha sp.]|nr:hypothetical protein [Candidatus Thiodiazotropha sp.]